jgi:hypothetical protein
MNSPDSVPMIPAQVFGPRGLGLPTALPWVWSTEPLHPQILLVGGSSGNATLCPLFLPFVFPIGYRPVRFNDYPPLGTMCELYVLPSQWLAWCVPFHHISPRMIGKQSIFLLLGPRHTLTEQNSIVFDVKMIFGFLVSAAEWSCVHTTTRSSFSRHNHSLSLLHCCRKTLKTPRAQSSLRDCKLLDHAFSPTQPVFTSYSPIRPPHSLPKSLILCTWYRHGRRSKQETVLSAKWPGMRQW